METNINRNPETLNVLLIGNNPIDMSRTLETLHQIKGQRVITEIAFDIQSIVDRLMRFKPNYILIDDNIGRVQLASAVDTLSQSRRTKNVPITVLKNSNYLEASASSRVLDFILKQNFSADSVYRAIKNSLKFRRTQLLLYKAYRKQKQQFRLSFLN